MCSHSSKESDVNFINNSFNASVINAAKTLNNFELATSSAMNNTPLDFKVILLMEFTIA